MRRKTVERAAAVRLRSEGWSLRRIANELDVSLSSVSTWVRHVPNRPPVRRPTPVEDDGQEDETTTIRCGRCRKSLPASQFSRHPTRGRQHWCRECFIQYFRARGDFHRAQSARARTKRRRAGRAFVDEYLSARQCVDCGEPDALVLEFDHLQVKNANVGSLLAEAWSVARLEQEIALCEVVCVNCHRRRTARRGTSWRLQPESLDTNTHLLPSERRNMKLVRDTLMQSACVDCGESDLLVLEFDHVGVKRASVPALARRGCALRTLQNEIDQCQIRCANCHRRRTRLQDRLG
jgi:hypothetical protein